MTGQKIYINDQKSWQKFPVTMRLQVIFPWKEYPHPHVYLIEPSDEMGRAHPDSLPRPDKMLVG